MRYYSGGEEDPYLDKASGILRNLLGIKDQATLEVSESSLSFLRANQLRVSPLRGNFDLAHLQAIHKQLFGDIYEWAGQIRTVEIIKGSTHFARRLLSGRNQCASSFPRRQRPHAARIHCSTGVAGRASY